MENDISIIANPLQMERADCLWADGVRAFRTLRLCEINFNIFETNKNHNNKKKIMKKLLTLAALTLNLPVLMFPGVFNMGSSYAQINYFVSSSGNDTYNGTSMGTPWQTIAKVNAAGLGVGDVVAFKGGEQFSDATLNCKEGVTYTSFGAGKAIIGDSTINTSVVNTILVNAANVILDNLKIYGYKDAERGITYNYGGMTINDCEIIGGENAHHYSTVAIRCDADGITSQITITNNIIRDWYTGGYFIQPYNFEFAYNTVYNMYWYRGVQNNGGSGFTTNPGETNEFPDAFSCDYTFNVHHNEFYNYE